MRLSFDLTTDGQLAEVMLSRRNLLALLHNLETPGSARTLGSGDCPAGWQLVVRVEDDDQHYDQRPFPAGPMRPLTERVIAARAERGEQSEEEAEIDAGRQREPLPPAATLPGPSRPLRVKPPKPLRIPRQWPSPVPSEPSRPARQPQKVSSQPAREPQKVPAG